jgi:hypothetical protein
MGYSIWDAIMGVPGTYYGFNPNTGDLTFGFSIDLWQATHAAIDSSRNCVEQPTCTAPAGLSPGTGIFFSMPDIHQITAGSYPSYGFGVFVTDYGTYTELSGIIPDLAITTAFLRAQTAYYDGLVNAMPNTTVQDVQRQTDFKEMLYSQLDPMFDYLTGLANTFLEAVFPDWR